MAIQKPPVPHVPYFTTQVYATLVVCAATIIYGCYNIGTDPGDLPATNWWWFLIWAGVFLALYIRMRLIRKRVEPVWKCQGVIPWSSPLQTEQHAVLDMLPWYACSSGLSIEHAKAELQNPAMLHRVKSDYALYLIAYGKEYGVKTS